MNDNRPSYQELQKYAQYVVQKAGKLLDSLQGSQTVAVMKDEVDLATSADLTSEQKIISLIHKKFPAHGIYSEEAGKSAHTSEFVWIIDPLDGTKEYARGVKEYSVLIALERKGELIVGAIQRNGINELYSCSLGNGATFNGKQIYVSEESNLEKSFVNFHLPSKSKAKEEIAIDMKILQSLIGVSYKVRAFFEDAKSLGYVARGIFGALVMPGGLKNGWWDLAPGILLVQEAGGVVTDWDGNRIKNHNLSNGIVASNGKLHKKLLEIINSERRKI